MQPKPSKLESASSNNDHQLNMVDYEVERRFEVRKRLGKGAYGIVWKAINRQQRDVVALKKIFDAFRDDTDAQRTYREVAYLRAFRTHPNIISILEIHKAANNMDFYLVFEFMESDLHDVIKKGNILKDVHKRFVMYQIINAVRFMHTANVVHRDLKPSNILIDSKCRLKVADLGLARTLNADNPNGEYDKNVQENEPLLTDYVATRWYRAPEILIASRKYTKSIDMWSIGCILGEMICQKPLFKGTSTLNQIEIIVNAMPDVTQEDIDSIGTGFGSDLLSKQIDRDKRIGLDEMLRSAHSEAIDLAKSLLVLNPGNRICAQDAMTHTYCQQFLTPSSEKKAKTNAQPPLKDNVRYSVEVYRANLYHIVSEMNRLGTLSEESSTRSSMLSLSRTSKSSKSSKSSSNGMSNNRSVQRHIASSKQKAKRPELTSNNRNNHFGVNTIHSDYTQGWSGNQHQHQHQRVSQLNTSSAARGRKIGITQDAAKKETPIALLKERAAVIATASHSQVNLLQSSLDGVRTINANAEPHNWQSHESSSHATPPISQLPRQQCASAKTPPLPYETKCFKPPKSCITSCSKESATEPERMRSRSLRKNVTLTEELTMHNAKTAEKYSKKRLELVQQQYAEAVPASCDAADKIAPNSAMRNLQVQLQAVLGTHDSNNCSKVQQQCQRVEQNGELSELECAFARMNLEEQQLSEDEQKRKQQEDALEHERMRLIALEASESALAMFNHQLKVKQKYQEEQKKLAEQLLANNAHMNKAKFYKLHSKEAIEIAETQLKHNESATCYRSRIGELETKMAQCKQQLVKYVQNNHQLLSQCSVRFHLEQMQKKSNNETNVHNRPPLGSAFFLNENCAIPNNVAGERKPFFNTLSKQLNTYEDFKLQQDKQKKRQLKKLQEAELLEAQQQQYNDQKRERLHQRKRLELDSRYLRDNLAFYTDEEWLRLCHNAKTPLAVNTCYERMKPEDIQEVNFYESMNQLGGTNAEFKTPHM